VGRPGGFVERLVRGTYAPHVVEHVALALQESAGHDVGFGRARAAGAPGTYVVVCAFGHAVVGVRALALALDLVRRAFAGVLRPDDAAAATDALRVLGTTPDPRAPLRALVPCAVSGGDAAGRATVVRALRTLARDADRDAPAVVEVAPSLGLTAGLPYRRARVAVVLDGEPGDDVAAFYREPDRALRLATLVLDTLADDGVAVVRTTRRRSWRTRARRWGRRARSGCGPSPSRRDPVAGAATSSPRRSCPRPPPMPADRPRRRRRRPCRARPPAPTAPAPERPRRRRRAVAAATTSRGRSC
jgi:hypothetical protein